MHHLGDGREGERKLEVLKTFIGHYLLDLAQSGYGIIKTVPTFESENASKSFAFTNVSYQILTKGVVTIQHFMLETQTASDIPVLVMFGVCTNRQLLTFPGKWSLGWLPTGESRLGTVWFSREMFLQRRLLYVLEEFNARTTILPKFVGIENGAWKCDLTTWEQDENHSRRGDRCGWKEVSEGSPRYLEFIWEHRDDWSHEREGTFYAEATGEYSLRCQSCWSLRF